MCAIYSVWDAECWVFCLILCGREERVCDGVCVCDILCDILCVSVIGVCERYPVRDIMCSVIVGVIVREIVSHRPGFTAGAELLRQQLPRPRRSGLVLPPPPHRGLRDLAIGVAEVMGTGWRGCARRQQGGD
jgi:hypothetical protein